MEKSRIDWTDSTWNPVTGCLHGCQYCYARGIAKRFSYDGKTLDAPAELQRIWVNDSKGNGVGNHVLRYPVHLLDDGRKVPYPFGFTPTFHRYRLNDYIGKKGRIIFVCSMADLFGNWVPDTWIDAVFEACERAPHHNYLFLTKNPDRYISLDMSDRLLHGGNVWYGLTVSDKKQAEAAMIAADMTEKAGAFLSIEPILEDVLIDELKTVIANFIDWVIVGAETGNRKGKVIPERKWIENIVELCREWEKPVFMKDSLSDVWGEPLIREWPEKLRPGSRR